MKNNLNKLTDAVGMLDEETVQEAMSLASGVKRRRTVRRRAVALIAACLALLLVAGALVAVPLLTAEAPVEETASGVPDTVIIQPDITPELGYTEYPLVKLSVESGVIDGAAEDGFPQVDIEAGICFRCQVKLSFDIAEGETVTVYAYQGDDATSPIRSKKDRIQLKYGVQGTEETEEESWGTELCTLTTEQPVLEWEYGSFDNGVMPEKVVLDYVVRDQDGQITGAGSVLVSHHRLIQNADHIYYDKGVIVRGADLGSVRFSDPADTTEEATVEYLDGLHDKIDSAYAALDFTPLTDEERYVAGWAEVINTYFDTFPEGVTVMSGFGGSSGDAYRVFNISVTPKDEDSCAFVDSAHLVPTDTMRIFIIFNDGSWGEVAEDEGWQINDETGRIENACRRITFTDGRMVDIQMLDYDGRNLYGPVYVTEDAVTDQN